LIKWETWNKNKNKIKKKREILLNQISNTVLSYKISDIPYFSNRLLSKRNWKKFSIVLKLLSPQNYIITLKLEIFGWLSLRKSIMGHIVNVVLVKIFLCDHPRSIGNDFIHPPAQNEQENPRFNPLDNTRIHNTLI
jgi:hypothetical protein